MLNLDTFDTLGQHWLSGNQSFVFVFMNAYCLYSEYTRQISTIERVSKLSLIFKNVKLSTF